MPQELQNPLGLKLGKEFDSYKPKVAFQIDEQRFTIKIAETEQELLGAFRLRNSVFYEEWTGKSSPTGLDIDKYDPLADHLIIIQKDTNQIMGTYRLIPSAWPKKESSKLVSTKPCFYTESLYDINDFLQKKAGNKVEMGRACTLKSLRGSQAIHYIWLGLSKYFRITFSRYMFGCVSIVDINKQYSASVYKSLLEKGLVDKKAFVPPIGKYQIKDFDTVLSKVKTLAGQNFKIPRLFLWYLSLGSRAHGPPAYDPEFKSYDFFISLDFKNIGNPKLISRYPDAVYLKKHLPD